MKSTIILFLLTITNLACTSISEVNSVDKKSLYEITFLEASIESSGFYKVNVLVKNTDVDKQIYIKPEKIVLIDGKGNNYNCVDIKLGKDELKYDSVYGKCITSTLYSNVPTKLSMSFKAENNLDIIKTLAVELILEKKSLDPTTSILKLANIQSNK